LFVFLILSLKYILYALISIKYAWLRGRRGRDRMVVGITTTNAISDYHNWCCEFESRSGRDVQHYVIKICQWLAVGRWFSPDPPVSSTNKTDHHRYNWNIVESGIKHHKTKPNKTKQNQTKPMYGCFSNNVILYMYHIKIKITKWIIK